MGLGQTQIQKGRSEKKNRKVRTLLIIRSRVAIALDLKEREPHTKDSGFHL